MNNKIGIAIFLTLTTLCTTAYGQLPRNGKISMHGIATPKHQLIMRSDIDSRINGIRVREGSNVSAGDVLIELDARIAIARVETAMLESQADGVLKNARAELSFARSRLKRISLLHGTRAINASELEDAQLQLEKAAAAVEIEQERMAISSAKYELAKAELEKYYLRSPIDGQVVLVKANDGQSVSQNDELLHVVSLDELRVELFLPMDSAAEMEIGGEYDLHVAPPYSRIVSGSLVFRSPIIEAATGTLRCVFEIENRSAQLPAGVSVRLTGHQRDSHAQNAEPVETK